MVAAAPGTCCTTGTETLAALLVVGALPLVTVTGAAAGRAGACAGRDGAARGLSKPGGNSDSGAFWARTNAELSASVEPSVSISHPLRMVTATFCLSAPKPVQYLRTRLAHL